MPLIPPFLSPVFLSFSCFLWKLTFPNLPPQSCQQHYFKNVSHRVVSDFGGLDFLWKFPFLKKSRKTSMFHTNFIIFISLFPLTTWVFAFFYISSVTQWSPCSWAPRAGQVPTWLKGKMLVLPFRVSPFFVWIYRFAATKV